MPDQTRMPSMPKSPPELVDRFGEAMARFPAAHLRKTFGYPCAYVNGNMATGLHGSAWFVRVGEGWTEELLALAGAGPFEPMPGRPMRGYTLLPASVLADDAALHGWIARALEHVATLPPKK
jgi:hypothetical protein